MHSFPEIHFTYYILENNWLQQYVGMIHFALSRTHFMKLFPLTFVKINIVVQKSLYYFQGEGRLQNIVSFFKNTSYWGF